MEKRHRHHVIPRHLGGSNDPENLVELDFIEHAKLHAERFISGEDGWFDNRHAGWPYLDEDTKTKVLKKQSELTRKRNLELSKTGSHPAQVAAQNGSHPWQSDSHRERARQLAKDLNEKTKRLGTQPSKRPEVKQKISETQKKLINEGKHFFGSDAHRNQARQRAIERNKSNRGCKHWVNAEGVRKFQKECPGPEWQHGQKWKDKNGN